MAVVAVVLFHFGVTAIPGGFVGVDIFFVISGYLMTRIIIWKIENHDFTLLRFYYDRAKRILPGLGALCSALLIFGFFFLDPVTYNKLSYSSIYALFFASDYLFYSWTGYFEPASTTHWLLHTWSLSVEWQFYMVYPVFVLVLYKIRLTRTYFDLLLCAAAAASFALCIVKSHIDPRAAFYFLDGRAWELLAGGIVARVFDSCPRRLSVFLQLGGFGAIFAALGLFDARMSWPNGWAAIPVLGTCCVIAASRSAGPVIGNDVIQFVGRWSYSIYLWHWPVAVGVRYFGAIETTPIVVLAEVLVLLLLLTPAVLLAAAIESAPGPTLRPIARAAGRSLVVFGPALVALLLAHEVDNFAGFANRRPGGLEQVRLYESILADWSFPRGCDGRDSAGRQSLCRLGQSSRPGVLIVGDSLAMQIYHRLVETSKTDPELSATFMVASGCPPVPNIVSIGDPRRCAGFVDDALRRAESGDYARLVLVSAWHGYFSAAQHQFCFVEGDRCLAAARPERIDRRLDAAFAVLGARLAEIRRKGIEIVIVAATPFSAWDVPLELLKRRFAGTDTHPIEAIDRAAFETASFPVNSRLRSLAASVDAHFIDPVEHLCDREHCPTVDAEGVSYFHDAGHYRAAAVRSDRFEFYDEAIGSARRRAATLPP